MKKLFMVVLVGLSLQNICADIPVNADIPLKCNCHVNYQEHDAEVDQKLNQKMHAVLQSFVTLVQGVVAIKQNPQDREKIGAHVGAILQSLVNVGVQASKCINVEDISPDERDILTRSLRDAMEEDMLAIIANNDEQLHATVT